MKKYVVIVASGSGKRMGGEIPKQFLKIKEKPILLHTLERVYSFNKEYIILLVLNKEHLHFWEAVIQEYKVDIPHRIVFGGSERFFSVRNALMSIDEKECLVAVHDGVRPLVSAEVFEKCFSLAEVRSNAVTCVGSVDSVRLMSVGSNNESVDRDRVKLIQTPQCFKLSLLKKAYSQHYEKKFTDDASLVENLGRKIYLCEGSRENIKITTPFDLKLAECLL